MDIESLLSSARVKTFAKGETVFSKGDSSEDGVYLVLAGSAAAIDSEGEQRELLAHMERGTLFGEVGLLLGTPRSSTVIAESRELKLVSVSSEIFQEEAQHNFNLLKGLVDATIRRILRLQEQERLANLRVRWGYPDYLEAILAKNRRHNLQLRDHLNHMRNMHPTRNHTLFQQGQKTDGNIYIVTQGEVAIYKGPHDGQERVGAWVEGDVFGYLHLVSEPERKYTARIESEDTRLVFLDRDLFFKIMRFHPEVFFGIYRTILTDMLKYQYNLWRAQHPATVAPETVAPETVAPETVVPEAIAPEAIAPDSVAPEGAATAGKATGANVDAGSEATDQATPGTEVPGEGGDA